MIGECSSQRHWQLRYCENFRKNPQGAHGKGLDGYSVVLINLILKRTDGLSLNLTYFFSCNYDLVLVDFFCYRAVSMYLGRVVEILPAAKLSQTPRHPYTRALADSVFVADPAARKQTVPIEGEVPSPFNLPAGCVFRTRCPQARDLCREDQPSLTLVSEGEYIACHFPLHE